MGKARMAQWLAQARQRWPGLLLCAVVALAATFVSGHYGGPQLLYALLVGLAFNFLATDARIRPGLDLCGRTLLRAGVALLGLRITAHQVVALGWQTAVLAVCALGSTIGLGLWLAHKLKRPATEGMVAGATVGICGASAALAVSSVLPASPENERFTLMAVVGVTLLSTCAMVLYPLLAQWVGLPPSEAGVFFGAAIHDVAQVVAAATLLSGSGEQAAADSAVIVKLFRVMLLMPVVLAVSLWWPRPAGGTDADAHTDTAGAAEPAPTMPLLPGFLLAFIVCMLINTTGLVGAELSAMGSAASRGLLVMAIAAVGIKTQPQHLRQMGWAPVVMLTAETVWIALFSLVAVHAW